MHTAVLVVALALTLASVACTVVPSRHGGAAVRRGRAAALLMGVSALDMAVPGGHLLHAAGWGAALIAAALVLLVPWPGGASRRTVGCGALAPARRRRELAWHAGSLLLMSAMWWTMTAPAAVGPAAVGSAAGGPPTGAVHAAHASAVPLAWSVVAVAGLLAIVAVATALPRAAGHRPGPAAWRHAFMAVGMLLMAAAMPVH